MIENSCPENRPQAHARLHTFEESLEYVTLKIHQKSIKIESNTQLLLFLFVILLNFAFFS